MIEILDSALANAEHPTKLDKLDLHLPICTASLPLAAAAQFAVPAALAGGGGGVRLHVDPDVQGGPRTSCSRRSGSGSTCSTRSWSSAAWGRCRSSPGAVLCWCLSFGRVLVKKTQDNSKKLLLNAFGKQPRYVWLYRDGVEVQVSLDRLQKGDIIVVNTGEVVPVDGHVVEGMAMIDQHALTGESTPAEKGVGDRVFASTVMVAGKVYVVGRDVGQRDGVGQDQPDPQRHGRLQAVVAAQGRAAGRQGGDPDPGHRRASGMATMGPAGAVAVLNSDFGTGIRMAAPLAMLSSLALCANKGILVKDGRALELMNEVDTVLFDKTGTLTRERPEVGRVIAADGFDAGADPAASPRPPSGSSTTRSPWRSCTRPQELGLSLPPTDDTQYKVGYGITVHVEGHTVRVGSKRFMEMEGIELPPEVREALDEAHREGYTMVMVGVDDRLGGAIELQAAVRPEVREIIAGPAQARDQAHRDHLGRPRGPDQEAGRIAGDGPLLRPGPARRQGRLRREAPEGRAARSASSATGSTTRSRSRRPTCRSRCGAPRRSRPTRRTSSSWRRGWRSSASCATSPATSTAT